MTMCNYNDYTELIIALSFDYLRVYALNCYWGFSALVKKKYGFLTLNFKISEEKKIVQKLDNYPLLLQNKWS